MRVPTGEIYKWILIQLLTLLHIRYFPVDLGIHCPSFDGDWQLVLFLWIVKPWIYRYCNFYWTLSFCCFSGAREPWNQGLSSVPQSADDPPQCQWSPSTTAGWSGTTKARSSSSGCQGTKGRDMIWTHENSFVTEDFAQNSIFISQ